MTEKGTEIEIYDFRCPIADFTISARPKAASVSLPLQLHLQLALEGLQVDRGGLVALLRGFEHQAALLVEGPLAADAIAEGNGAAHHGAGAHQAIDLERKSADAGGSRDGGDAF